MTIAYVTEHNQLAKDTVRGPLLVGEGAGTEQVVNYTAGATQSSPFGADTHIIRFHTDAACHIAFGTNPTAAAATSRRLAANQTEFFHVTPGEKISIITA